ncbi:MAG: MptD family putative ECF transporter S component [Bacteroidota bacterium]
MDNKLRTQDLITIGIFSAIYIIAYIVLAGVLFTPVLLMFMMPLGALLMGPVYMLYIARIQKVGAIAIMGFLTALIIGFIFQAGNILIAFVIFGFGLLTELAAYLGRYKSLRWNVLSYCLMSLWVIGVIGPFWVAGDWIRELTITSGYPAEYADGVISLATPLNLGLIIVGTLIGALVSSMVANRMLKKHFVRAGIA